MADTIDWERIDRSCQSLLDSFSWPSPSLAVVLGSGLSGTVEGFENLHTVPYHSIDALGGSTVQNHQSEIFLGRLAREGKADATVLFYQGRRHYYEGVGFTPIAFPIAFAARLGCKRILITAAAGALSERFVGQRCLARIEDHLDLFFPSPLLGSPLAGRDRFFPTAEMYDGPLGSIVEESFSSLPDIEPRRGVYAAVEGPNYESAATARALAQLGADFVGMSTVPEALIAAALGLDVAGIVSVTNDSGKASNNHGEVGEASVDNLPDLRRVIQDVAGRVVDTPAE